MQPEESAIKADVEKKPTKTDLVVCPDGNSCRIEEKEIDSTRYANEVTYRIGYIHNCEWSDFEIGFRSRDGKSDKRLNTRQNSPEENLWF